MKNKAANAPIAFAEIIMVMIKCGMDFASHLKKISLNINPWIKNLKADMWLPRNHSDSCNEEIAHDVFSDSFVHYFRK